jgi:hypothetical protein
MNLLIPLLTPRPSGAYELPPGLPVIDDLLTSMTLPPAEAAPGTLCLLRYDDATWDTFAGQAQETDGPPSSATIAVAGLRSGEHWIAVPDLPFEEQPLVAMWRVGSDETLQVGIADLRETGTALADVIDVLQQTPDAFDAPVLSVPCENRTSDLSCANRGCHSGSCVEYSWFDPDRGVRLYACVCAS